MTYCVGMRTRHGLVIISDTRTNAGIDNISIYNKLHVLADDEDKLIFAASAGSLSVTQSMLAMLSEGLAPESDDSPRRTVEAMPTMFRVAQLVGEALSAAWREATERLKGTGINASVSLLLGGRVGNGPLTLYLCYSQGNFIECQPDAPYAQVGELKYGKPILDRVLNWETALDEAVKVGLISFDSTMRSNLSVGPPLDLVVIPEDRSRNIVRMRIGVDDPYLRLLSGEWGRLMNEARQQIPDPPFLQSNANDDPGNPHTIAPDGGKGVAGV
jgi:putative proteasome-type protease